VPLPSGEIGIGKWVAVRTFFQGALQILLKKGAVFVFFAAVGE
jgi:hypothetical protein